MRLDSLFEFNGNCKEAFAFYQELFSGTGLFQMTWGDSPAASQVPADQQGKIMHAHLMIGPSHLMGSDAVGPYNKPQGSRICAEVESSEEAERLFNALSEGGEVTVPLAETFWAVRFGMLTDRFGVPWMVNQSRPMPAQA